MIYIFIDAPNGAHGLLTSHIKFLHDKKIFFKKKSVIITSTANTFC